MKINKHKTGSFNLTRAAHVYLPASKRHHLHSTLFISAPSQHFVYLNSRCPAFPAPRSVYFNGPALTQWGAKEKAPGFPRYRRCTDNQPQNNDAPGLGNKLAEFALASRIGCHAGAS